MKQRDCDDDRIRKEISFDVNDSKEERDADKEKFKTGKYMERKSITFQHRNFEIDFGGVCINKNPELYPLVAEILLELQKNGVQVFLATHSYNFAKYLEIRRTNKKQVMFHNLYKGRNLYLNDMKKMFSGMDNCDEAIYSQSADRMDDIKYNHIMAADNKLLDEVYNLLGNVCEEYIYRRKWYIQH